MKRQVFFILIAMLLLITPVAAQLNQTGAIAGTVTDSEKAPLSGILISLRSPSLVIGKKTTLSAQNGVYRFPALTPGLYELSFEGVGMNTVLRKNIRVSLGQTIAIDVQMSLSTLHETIMVEGKTPTVDRQHTSRAANMDKDFLRAIPARRTLDTFFDMAPGVSGKIAHGSAEMSNSYNLDGVNITDPATNEMSVKFGLEIMEEVAVQAGAISAEYGSVQGAMVNVISKSGGNRFSGGLSIYYNHEKLVSDNTANTSLEGQKSGNRLEFEPSITLGGPVLRDRMWFFISGSNNIRERFYINYNDPWGEKGKPIPVRTQRPTGFAKLTFMPGAGDKWVISYNFNGLSDNHYGAEWGGRDKDATIISRNPIHTLNLHYTHFFGENLFFNLKMGAVLNKIDWQAKNDDPTYVVNGIWTHSQFRKDEMQKRHRLQLNADATTYLDDFLGSHEVKIGAEYWYSPTRWRVRTPTDPVTGGAINWGGYAPDGSFVYAMTLVSLGNGQNRKEDMHNAAFFVQDNWSVTPRLSLNIGLRLDYEGLIWPRQNENEGTLHFWDLEINRAIKESITPFSWMMLSPRLGFIYDPFATGKTLIKGSWSRYMAPSNLEFINLSHPNGWIFALQFLTPNGQQIPYAYLPIAIPGLVHSGYKDHELDAPYQDEFSIGVEHEFLTDWSAGVRFIRKMDRNLIHLADAAQFDLDKYYATGALDWSKNWIPVEVQDPTNPGKTLTFYSQIDPTKSEQYVVNLPDAKRNYSGLELTVKKRFSRGFGLDLSYVYSRSEGLIDASYSSEAVGTSNLFKNPHAHVNNYGRLPTERPHQLKVSAVTALPWDVTFSGFFTYMSGNRYSRLVKYGYLPNTTVILNGDSESAVISTEKRGSRGLPALVNLDLRLTKNFRIGKLTNLSIFVDCFNVLNTNTATALWVTDFAPPSQKFETLRSIVSPRTFQLGARVEF